MKGIFVIVFSFIGMTSFSQEAGNSGKEKFVPHHSISLTIGHQHAFNGRDEDGNPKTLILPFWGINYNFQFAPKFSIGLHTDFIVESFEVEKNHEGGTKEVVERTRPIAPAVMGFYKPTMHWSFGLGIGGEFAKEENYLVTRLGVEYGAEVGKGWEIFGGPQYDFRWQAYDTWTIGLGIAKVFGGKKE